MTKHFCILPFIHHEVKSNGNVSPCCVSKIVYRDENGIPFNANNSSINDILNSEHANRLRHDLLDDKPGEGCHQCYTEEMRRGITTRRIRENDRFSDIIATDNSYIGSSYVDLKFGNTCNNACMICGPELSSKWAEQYKLANIPFDRTNNNKNYKWYEDSEYWNTESEFSNLRYLDIYGGEPFLIKQQWEFIEKLVESGHSNHIRLNYATNGTVYPEHAIKNLWPHFEKVDILFSSDGIKDVHEYSRWPSKWEDFERNLRLFHEHGFTPNISYCISNYSVWDLPRSLAYYSQYNGAVKVWLNGVYDSGSDVAFLPSELKHELLTMLNRELKPEWESMLYEKNYDTVFDSIASEHTVDHGINSFSDGWNTFLSRVRTFDKIRGLDIVDVIPQYNQYINN